jgi:cobalt/nickel transport system permease protein
MDEQCMKYRANKPGVISEGVHLLLMTYRYIFVIEREYQRLMTAIKIRGFRSGTNIHSYRTFAYLIGMIFVRASIRAQRVHQAMLCRGFKGRFYTLAGFRPFIWNWIFSILMAGVMAGLVVMEISAYG